MSDHQELLADFERWTGKGNLIQANKVALQLFHILLTRTTPEPEEIVVAVEPSASNILNEAIPDVPFVSPSEAAKKIPVKKSAVKSSATAAKKPTTKKPVAKKAIPKGT